MENKKNKPLTKGEKIYLQGQKIYMDMERKRGMLENNNNNHKD